nr:solute carrier family 22 member 3-like isoform X1 [Procambarus clarkii]XP_045619962.1 solute carrier family 22 member 3-like isoform X2 [Procambarus clarkii]XP_045619971.1 solute carrier family 22 member 3-like isoform X2 [Procambarus clarkii]XP_045619979.1 solute carrier family 22 member 3-like isoform X2 [Procambarus clarkii]
MHFEDLLAEIGSFGLYQRLLCFVLIPLTTGVVGLTFYVQLFLLTAPPHTCLQEPRPQSAGDQAAHPLYQDLSRLLNDTAYDTPARLPYTCHQFDPNVTSAYITSSDINLTSLGQLPPPNMPCVNGWQYNFDHIFPTYTSQHDWVCTEAWRPYMVVTVFWIGNTIGSWLWGALSDTCGRRPTVVASLAVYGAAGVASVFINNFYGFVALRFLVGTSHHTVSHLPFVLVVEYCGVESRVVPLLTLMMSYTLASILIPALAFVVWDGFTLALITALLPLVLLLAFRWIPESSSWLVARGRGEAARAQLTTVAKVNGHQLPQEMVTQLLHDADDGEEGHSGYRKRDAKGGHRSQTSIIHAIKYPSLRKNILLVLLIWMLACMCYYGHCQNTAHLASNVFMSYLLGALVEVPSWCVPWLIHRLGRRRPLTATFLLSGVAGLVYALVPADMEWLLLVVALAGRATITGAYYITLQYCPEVFPTVVRGQGVALAETLGGVAIFLSPSIVYLGEWQKRAPLMVFSGLSVMGGMATLLLPETAGVVLPQTLHNADLFFSQAATPCSRCSLTGGERETEADL